MKSQINKEHLQHIFPSKKYFFKTFYLFIYSITYDLFFLNCWIQMPNVGKYQNIHILTGCSDRSYVAAAVATILSRTGDY